MAGLASSLKSPRALFAGGAFFYFLSIWFISQQYHVTLLDKVRGGASSIKILSETGVKPSDAKNGTLGVRADQRLQLHQLELSFLLVCKSICHQYEGADR